MKIVWEPNVPGEEAMPRDRALLEVAENGEPGARLYTWASVWVTLGRSQTPETALRPGCKIPTSIRPTGGKAVLHGHDLTIGLALPLSFVGLPDGTRELKAAYRRVIAPIVEGMAKAGLDAVLAESTPFVRSRGKVADCFAHISPNDVVNRATGQKLCGCALRLTDRAILVQASIPVAEPLVDPNLVYAHAAIGGKNWADLTILREAIATQFSASFNR